MIKRVTRTNITVCNDTVTCSPGIKLLGSYLDQSLTMSTHITKKCSLGQCGTYHLFDPLKTTWILIPSRPLFRHYAISHLDYSNALFYGLPTKDINCLQCVQNSCAKLVLGKNRYDSSLACLKQLHWLPVKFGIRFKILCIMPRVDNDSAPVYLHKIVNKRVFHRQTRCATTPGSLYEIPFIERKTFQARAFFCFRTD